MSDKLERAKLAAAIFNAGAGNPYRGKGGRYTSGPGGGSKSAGDKPKDTAGGPKPRPYKDETGKWVYGIPPHLRGDKPVEPPVKPAKEKKPDDGKPKPRPYKDENGKWVYGIPPHLRGDKPKEETVKPVDKPKKETIKPAEKPKLELSDIKWGSVDGVRKASIRGKLFDKVYNLEDKEQKLWDKLSDNAKIELLNSIPRIKADPKEARRLKTRFDDPAAKVIPAKDHLIYEGYMDPSRLKRVNDTYDYLSNKYPTFKQLMETKPLRTVLTDVDHLSYKDYDGKTHNGAIGLYTGGKHQVEYAVAEHHLRRAEELNVGSRAFTVDPSFAGTVRHEMGHHLHNNLWNLKPATSRETNMNVKWEQLYDKYKDDRSQWTSQYGNTNHREYFAESFCTYTSPRYRQGMLPQDVHNFMEALLK